ncbi:unnamed protein product [Rotaria magnacalcarata]|uniref:ER membrane protein complex subunit 2 n=1 Tax=Rotaria magnacalcarata TaxID=392030 RepID=A0A819DEB8_9BILA|nr:unnamed protein product [Rotaria magnacalcarata]CAF2109738.1 unnamed protein product [Rotaria magnacalcarata]CAF2124785.1 unnamed protein product [Rotaria magnacalcarata]CAF3827683.1 unnamed protein product [Rotaria magnacalcarata]CAF3929402.1 unnamed protein product [Rotaria magnacalcarata]
MQSAIEKLRKYREENYRSHDEVIELWKTVLSKHNLSSLGDEKWLVLEQVFKCALHCSQQPIALECLGQLTKEFKSTSHRLSVLKAMYDESIGDYEKAEQVYSALLKDNETDAIIHKRKICLLKEQNKIRDAINELNTYLELYQVDQEAWGELCELYLLEHDYAKAAFCAEELILINPHNHLNHERYASICYSNGGYEFARAYYFSTIKFNPNNMRALYGILLTSANMKSRNLNENSNKIIKEQILQKYKETMPDLLPFVEMTLQSFISS